MGSGMHIIKVKYMSKKYNNKTNPCYIFVAALHFNEKKNKNKQTRIWEPSPIFFFAS